MLCTAATFELPGDDDYQSDLGLSNCDDNGNVENDGDDNGDDDDGDDDDNQHGRHGCPTIGGGVEIHGEHLWLVPAHQ